LEIVERGAVLCWILLAVMFAEIPIFPDETVPRSSHPDGALAFPLSRYDARDLGVQVTPELVETL
jgi:hypothetical protein